MRILITMIIALALASSISFAAGTDRTITVSGHAKIIQPAQFASLEGRLKIIDETPEASLSDITQSLKQLASQLAEHSIHKEDIVVSQITQGPEYTWQNNSRTLSGYYAAATVQIRIEEITTVYAIYNLLAGYPSLSLKATTYGRHDVEQMHKTALSKALVAAAAKARSMAETLDCSLGEVLRIAEGGHRSPPVPMQSVQASPQRTELHQQTTTGTVITDAFVTVEFALQ